MNQVNRDDRPPLRTQNVPGTVARQHAKKITEEAVKNSAASSDGNGEEQYSLNDDRRVKVLSPGAMVAKRFFRNRIAVVGLAILAFMFLFSFLGGIITPYQENQQFYREDVQHKDYAGVVKNEEFRYIVADGQELGNVLQAQVILAMQRGQDSFTYKDTDYLLTEEGPDLYRVSLSDGTTLGFAYKDIVSSSVEGTKLSFEFQSEALLAFTNGLTSFSADGMDYTIDDTGVVSDGSNEVAFISRYVVQPVMADVFLTRAFQEELIECLQEGKDVFTYTDESGVEAEYTITYRADLKTWTVLQETATRVYDTYSYPSKAHWLGTDRNGMDMLTRLMYGGRVSLIIGFIVEIISTVLGIILGGIAGYFGKWVDNLIMRIVDIFYCIPSMPLIIILGAAMDAMSVDPQLRMLYLMLILGFLGWPGMARLIRGQILSLREQEFMTATEALGISVSRRIFKHLVPNVIPQIIVSVSMGIGGTILTEATLSFLGLGVKFPFASWGNIINDVNNTFVLTTYWFIWIPAGLLLLLTVLAFNLVGDGLRDAFDPKMKR
ncbi:MAG: ABC transporter permease [Oscillospiraceae bacterium]|nr:ABC transporter permease [Oscillospiraceae bacterium]